DLLGGAPYTAAGGADRGEAYVVFGGTGLGGTTVTLSTLGTGGFTRRGFENVAEAGRSVSGAGDVNGDGFDDLLVGAPYTDVGGRARGGGDGDVGGTGLGGRPVTLKALGTGGFTLRGVRAVADAGLRVRGAGEVHGGGV